MSNPAELRSTTTEADERARLAQALEDLAASDAASVSLVHVSSRKEERALVKALGAAARKLGFASAEASVREHALDAPEILVRQVLDGLVPAGDDRPQGLLWLLDEFWEQHGDDSVAAFDKACASQGAAGDLTALCRAYLATGDGDDTAEIRAYTAWCDGVEPPRKYRDKNVRWALSERTAQRSLNELTRVLRAIGYRGLLLLLPEADIIASLTERQREKAYTVLRELADNFDAAGGAVATRVILTGREALFEGERSVRSLAPLAMRLEIPSDARPAPPHRSWTHLAGERNARHRRAEPSPGSASGLRNLVRISEGLPPVDRVTRMSVGAERLDKSIARLFELVNRSGRFFSLLVGEYGSGKTHWMMHLAERALEDQRPVFWLNLERTNLDLGNPARHLSRLLEHSVLPTRGKPNALSLASKWTRSAGATDELRALLGELAEGDDHAAAAARKALRIAEHARDPGFALERYLSAADLHDRPGDPSRRKDAYRRLFLWFKLLGRREDTRGPVILIDEAENLYTSGLPPASRRTALRSLSFYCGGALSGACVIMAMTPPAVAEMRQEARGLLKDAREMQTTLDLEDVAGFSRSLWKLKPDPVKPLTRAERRALCDNVRKMHKSARGKVEIDDWSAMVDRLVAAHDSPRTLARALIDELDSTWWAR